MQPRKILFVNHVAGMAGAEQGLLNLIRCLDTSQYSVTVALPSGGPLEDAVMALGAQVVHVDICRLTKTWNPFLLLKYYMSWLRGSRQLARLIVSEGIDLVHANSNTAQIYAGEAAALAGVPCVWHSRDLVELGVLFRRMSSQASRVIAISGAVEAHLKDRGVDPEKLIKIHNAVDTDAFRPAGNREKARKALGVDGGCKLVAMVGQMVSWKKHGDFLACARAVCESLPDTRFVIIGGDVFGDDSGYSRSIAERAKGELDGKVVLAGWQDDMATILDGVDVIVHPAEREPFGRSILEAMAMGCPVVAVDACGPAEIISDGTDGLLVPAGDVGAMAKGVQKLLTDEDLAMRIGRAARKRVEAGFTMARLRERVCQVYDTVLSGAGNE